MLNEAFERRMLDMNGRFYICNVWLSVGHFCVVLTSMQRMVYSFATHIKIGIIKKQKVNT